MSGRTYQRLTIQDFGAHLLRTGDLDPVYITLHRLLQDGTWPVEAVLKWLVAYWCFYDCGLASFTCWEKSDQFWYDMVTAAENDASQPSPLEGGRWPRGRERRHFRGKAGVSAVKSLASRYPEPGEMVRYIVAGAPDYQELTRRVTEHESFGPWISFKVADMTDRVLGVKVDFTQAAVFMFKDPVKAAVMRWNQQHNFPLDQDPTTKKFLNEVIIPTVVADLEHEFRDCLAPPRYERPVGLQEVETVLCKWKSHMNGHYPLYNDITEIRHGVKQWAPYSECAADFLAAMPEVGV